MNCAKFRKCKHFKFYLRLKMAAIYFEMETAVQYCADFNVCIVQINWMVI